MKALALLLAAIALIGSTLGQDRKANPQVLVGSATASPGKCKPPRVVLIPPTAPPNSTQWSTGAPPERYQGNTRASEIRFASPDEVDRIRNNGVPTCGYRVRACEIDGRLVMPNPCTFTQIEPYAHLLCHEVGHLNGWPLTHGD